MSMSGDYYVDNVDGDDDATGTESDPVRTVRHIVDSHYNSWTRIFVKKNDGYAMTEADQGATPIRIYRCDGNVIVNRTIEGYENTPGDGGLVTFDVGDLLEGQGVFEYYGVSPINGSANIEVSDASEGKDRRGWVFSPRFAWGVPQACPAQNQLTLAADDDITEALCVGSILRFKYIDTNNNLIEQYEEVSDYDEHTKIATISSIWTHYPELMKTLVSYEVWASPFSHVMHFSNCRARFLDGGSYMWWEKNQSDYIFNHSYWRFGAWDCRIGVLLSDFFTGNTSQAFVSDSAFVRCGEDAYDDNPLQGGLTAVTSDLFVNRCLFLDNPGCALLWDFYTRGQVLNCTFKGNGSAIYSWDNGASTKNLRVEQNIFDSNDYVLRNHFGMTEQLTRGAFIRFRGNWWWNNTVNTMDDETLDWGSEHLENPLLNSDGSLSESSPARRSGLAHPGWLDLIRTDGADDGQLVIEGKGPMTVATSTIGDEVTLEAFQSEARTLTLTITDADGEAVDLSAGTLTFIVQDMSSVPTEVFRLEGASLIVGGAENNELALALNATDLDAARRDLKWRLWLDDEIVGHGAFWIHPAVSPTES